jgi:hypothetical protein
MNDTRDDVSLNGAPAATFWDEFATLLADPVSFSALWEHDSYEVRRLWAALEECSAYRIEHVYAAALEAPEAALPFVRGLPALLRDMGLDEAAKAIHLRRLAEARAHGDPWLVQQALGDAATTTFDTKVGLAWARQRERLCRALGELDGLREALGARADAIFFLWIFSGDDDDADDDADEDSPGIFALEREQECICLKTGNLVGLQAWLAGRALHESVDGNAVRGLRLTRRRARLCRAIGELDGLWQSLLSLARWSRKQGDLGRALKSATEAAAICRDLGHLRGRRDALAEHGLVLVLLGRREDALKVFAQQAGLRAVSESSSVLQSVASAAGHARGDSVPSQALFEDLEWLARSLDDPLALQAALGGHADFLAEIPHRHRALALTLAQESLCRRHGERRCLKHALERKAVLLWAADPPSAIHAVRESEALSRDDACDWGQKRALELRAELEYASGDLAAALETFRELEAFACARPRDWLLGDYVEDARLGQLYVLDALLRGCSAPGRAIELVEEQHRVARLVGLQSERSVVETHERLAMRRLGLRDIDDLPRGVAEQLQLAAAVRRKALGARSHTGNGPLARRSAGSRTPGVRHGARGGASR